MLDWNKASIDYYARKGAVNLTAQEGWVVFRYGIQADISSTEKEDKIDALKSVCTSCSSRQYYVYIFAAGEKAFTSGVQAPEAGNGKAGSRGLGRASHSTNFPLRR